MNGITINKSVDFFKNLFAIISLIKLQVTEKNLTWIFLLIIRSRILKCFSFQLYACIERYLCQSYFFFFFIIKKNYYSKEKTLLSSCKLLFFLAGNIRNVLKIVNYVKINSKSHRKQNPNY